jgi:hypothetical protein
MMYGAEDFVGSSVDLATTLADPTLVGVKIPALVIVPSVAVKETKLSVLPSLL